MTKLDLAMVLKKRQADGDLARARALTEEANVAARDGDYAGLVPRIEAPSA